MVGLFSFVRGKGLFDFLTPVSCADVDAAALKRLHKHNHFERGFIGKDLAG